MEFGIIELDNKKNVLCLKINSNSFFYRLSNLEEILIRQMGNDCYHNYYKVINNFVHNHDIKMDGYYIMGHDNRYLNLTKIENRK